MSKKNLIALAGTLVAVCLIAVIVFPNLSGGDIGKADEPVKESTESDGANLAGGVVTTTSDNTPENQDDGDGDSAVTPPDEKAPADSSGEKGDIETKDAQDGTENENQINNDATAPSESEQSPVEPEQEEQQDTQTEPTVPEATQPEANAPQPSAPSEGKNNIESNAAGGQAPDPEENYEPEDPMENTEFEIPDWLREQMEAPIEVVDANDDNSELAQRIRDKMNDPDFEWGDDPSVYK